MAVNSARRTAPAAAALLSDSPSRRIRRAMPDDTHIALIDDDPAVLDSLRLYLERNGIRVACYSAAEEFLGRKPGERTLDCIVSDVRMPGLSGIELARTIASRGNLVPVVLITAHGDVDMAVSAIKLGASDFIEKPFDEARLLASILHAVSRVRKTRDELSELQELRARTEALTDRQREVMELAGAGL